MDNRLLANGAFHQSIINKYGNFASRRWNGMKFVYRQNPKQKDSGSSRTILTERTFTHLVFMTKQVQIQSSRVEREVKWFERVVHHHTARTVEQMILLQKMWLTLSPNTFSTMIHPANEYVQWIQSLHQHPSVQEMLLKGRTDERALASSKTTNSNNRNPLAVQWLKKDQPVNSLFGFQSNQFARPLAAQHQLMQMHLHLEQMNSVLGQYQMQADGIKYLFVSANATAAPAYQAPALYRSVIGTAVRSTFEKWFLERTGQPAKVVLEQFAAFREMLPAVVHLFQPKSEGDGKIDPFLLSSGASVPEKRMRALSVRQSRNRQRQTEQLNPVSNGIFSDRNEQSAEQSLLMIRPGWSEKIIQLQQVLAGNGGHAAASDRIRDWLRVQREVPIFFRRGDVAGNDLTGWAEIILQIFNDSSERSQAKAMAETTTIVYREGETAEANEHAGPAIQRTGKQQAYLSEPSKSNETERQLNDSVKRDDLRLDSTFLQKEADSSAAPVQRESVPLEKTVDQSLAEREKQVRWQNESVQPADAQNGYIQQDVYDVGLEDVSMAATELSSPDQNTVIWFLETIRDLTTNEVVQEWMNQPEIITRETLERTGAFSSETMTMSFHTIQEWLPGIAASLMEQTNIIRESGRTNQTWFVQGISIVHRKESTKESEKFIESFAPGVNQQPERTGTGTGNAGIVNVANNVSTFNEQNNQPIQTSGSGSINFPSGESNREQPLNPEVTLENEAGILNLQPFESNLTAAGPNLIRQLPEAQGIGSGDRRNDSEDGQSDQLIIRNEIRNNQEFISLLANDPFAEYTKSTIDRWVLQQRIQTKEYTEKRSFLNHSNLTFTYFMPDRTGGRSWLQEEWIRFFIDPVQPLSFSESSGSGVARKLRPIIRNVSVPLIREQLIRLMEGERKPQASPVRKDEMQGEAAGADFTGRLVKQVQSMNRFFAPVFVHLLQGLQHSGAEAVTILQQNDQFNRISEMTNAASHQSLIQRNLYQQLLFNSVRMLPVSEGSQKQARGANREIHQFRESVIHFLASLKPAIGTAESISASALVSAPAPASSPDNRFSAKETKELQKHTMIPVKPFIETETVNYHTLLLHKQLRQQAGASEAVGHAVVNPLSVLMQTLGNIVNQQTAAVKDPLQQIRTKVMPVLKQLTGLLPPQAAAAFYTLFRMIPGQPVGSMPALSMLDGTEWHLFFQNGLETAKEQIRSHETVNRNPAVRQLLSRMKLIFHHHQSSNFSENINVQNDLLKMQQTIRNVKASEPANGNQIVPAEPAFPLKQVFHQIHQLIHIPHADPAIVFAAMKTPEMAPLREGLIQWMTHQQTMQLISGTNVLAAPENKMSQPVHLRLIHWIRSFAERTQATPASPAEPVTKFDRQMTEHLTSRIHSVLEQRQEQGSGMNAEPFFGSEDSLVYQMANAGGYSGRRQDPEPESNPARTAGWSTRQTQYYSEDEEVLFYHQPKSVPAGLEDGLETMQKQLEQRIAESVHRLVDPQEIKEIRNRLDGLDMDRMIDRIFREFEQKISMERQRRGMF